MDSITHAALLRHFNDRRLHPHIPEHALFIRGEIAKLEVVDPSAAASFKAFYDEKLVAYMQEHPQEFVVADPEGSEDTVKAPKEEKEEVKEAKETDAPTETLDTAIPEKKKPGRKPKIISPI